MLEDLSDGFAFIIGTVGSLSDLFKNDVLNLRQALIVYCNGCALKTPAFEDAGDEPVLFVNWSDSIAVGVVAAECLFGDLSTGASLLNELHEVVHDGLCFFLAGSYTGVVWCIVLGHDFLERHTGCST